MPNPNQHQVPSAPTANEDFLTEKQIAPIFGLSFRTLQNWRSIGTGPKYTKIGQRVLYRFEDFDQWYRNHYVHEVHPNQHQDFRSHSKKKAV